MTRRAASFLYLHGTHTAAVVAGGVGPEIDNNLNNYNGPGFNGKLMFMDISLLFDVAK